MPSVAIVRPYEAVYIVDPDLGEEQISTITGRYKQIIETNGGTVAKVDVWERRKLAYEVKGRTEGIYVVMHFSGTSKAESELRRIFQISEDQIRSLIVKLDEADAEAPTDAPQAAPADAAPAPAPAAEVSPAAEVVPAAPAAETAPVAEIPAAAITTDAAPALAAEQVPA